MCPLFLAEMGKFMKPGKVVMVLAGRYAGRKAVIVKVRPKNFWEFFVRRLKEFADCMAHVPEYVHTKLLQSCPSESQIAICLHVEFPRIQFSGYVMRDRKSPITVHVSSVSHVFQSGSPQTFCYNYSWALCSALITSCIYIGCKTRKW